MLMLKDKSKKLTASQKIGFVTMVVLTVMVLQSSFAIASTDASKKQCVVDLELAADINRWVNRNVIFVTDQEAHGVRDYWQTLRETLRRGTGDCEDYAIAKWTLLQQYGVAQHDLQIWYGYQGPRPHIVVMYCGQVLDNLTNKILPITQTTFIPKFRVDDPTIRHWQNLTQRIK